MTRHERLTEMLGADLSPLYLEVIDESHRHSVPSGSETHFKLIIAAEVFEGLRLVQRHQKVNALLDGELRSGLHALSMETLTPKEWAARDGQVLESPPCLGGSKAG